MGFAMGCCGSQESCSSAVPPLACGWGPAPVCSHHSLRPPAHLVRTTTTLVSTWSSLGKLGMAFLQVHQCVQRTPQLLRGPAIMSTSFLLAAVFSYCVFTLQQRKKPIELLAITNVSNNYGFNNTMLHGPREDCNSTKWPKVIGAQTERWPKKM